MILRHCGAALLTATLLIAPSAIGETRANNARSVAVQASADARAKTTLREAVAWNVAEERLGESLSSYTILPSLVQLRRYVEVGHRPKLVCVVDLVLQDQEGGMVVTIRGSATTVGATPKEAVFAAARAAVVRIPSALQASRPLRASAIAIEHRTP